MNFHVIIKQKQMTTPSPFTNQKDHFDDSQLQQCQNKIHLDYSTVQNVEELSFLLELQLDDLDDEPSTKRERKKAFAKYKKPSREQEIFEKQSQSALELFDSIFINKKDSRKQKIVQTEKNSPKRHKTQTNNLLEDITLSFQEFLSDLNFSTDLENFADKKSEEYINQNSQFENVLHPIHEEEEKVPMFLKRFRFKNSAFPNFNHSNICFLTENQNVKILLYQCETAFQELRNLFQKIENKKDRLRLFSPQFKQAFTVEYFIGSGWDRYVEFEGIERLKPVKNFTLRKINFEKIRAALQNYEQVIKLKKEESSFNFHKASEQERYWQLRQRLWEIEKNMKLISEDLYVQGIKSPFPEYYHDYLHFLRAPLLKKHPGMRAIQYRRKVQKNIMYLQSEREPLTCSQIGQRAKKRIRVELNTFL